MTAKTDAYENKEVDWTFRGQAFGLANTTAAAGTGPSTWYIGALTANATDSTPGTEVSGGSYARVAVACTLANWAGTQGAGTTAISSGTSGTTSNNIAITFPASTAAWGTITGWGAYDSLTGGTLCHQAALTANMAVGSAGITPAFGPGTLTYQVDN